MTRLTNHIIINSLKFKLLALICIFQFVIKYSSSQQFVRIDSITNDSIIIDTIDLVPRKFQLTVFHPIGSNLAKLNYVNKLSLNLLWGYEGGLNGTEIGLLGNVNEYITTGNQIAGLVNSSRGRLVGTQCALLLNKAQTVKGNQIGFINVCDSIEGKQIGFLNINQYNKRNFEIYANEYIYINMSYKVGKPEYYKIIAIGIHPFGSKFKTAFGIGFGKESQINERHFRNTELLLMQVNENEFITKKLNTIINLRLNYGKKLLNQNKIYAGLNLNLMFSNYYDSTKQRYGSDISPWPIYDSDIITDKLNLQFWPGISFGIIF